MVQGYITADTAAFCLLLLSLTPPFLKHTYAPLSNHLAIMGSTADAPSDLEYTDTLTHHTNRSNGIVTKPTILHLGDPIIYNHSLYSQLSSKYTIINPAAPSLERSAFKKHLQDRTWGNFSAIMRPFWNTGGEMGRWDQELIELLPTSMRVMASAGAGFDWVDTGVLAEFGMCVCISFMQRADSCAIPDCMIVNASHCTACRQETPPAPAIPETYIFHSLLPRWDHF